MKIIKIPARSTVSVSNRGSSRLSNNNVENEQTSDGSPSHAFDLRLLQGPSTNTYRYLHTFIADDLACAKDHIVFDKMFVPADYYIELIYLCAARYFELHALRIDQMKFDNSLALEVGQIGYVVIEIADLGESQYSFKVFSSQNSALDTKLKLISGTFRKAQNTLGKSLESPLDRANEYPLDTYTNGKNPIQLGPFYHSLYALTVNAKGSSGSIRRSDSKIHYLLQPDVVSAALQAALCTADFSSGSIVNEKQLFLPVRIRGLHLPHRISGTNFHCSIVVLDNSSDGVSVSLDISDHENNKVLSIDELLLKHVHRTQLVPPSPKKAMLSDEPHLPSHKNRQTTETSIPVSSDRHETAKKTYETYDDDIAIVGVSCRFPGSSSLSEFWQNIEKGSDSITEVPSDRWLEFPDWFHLDPENENTASTKWGGFIEDYDKFDPLFFNISPADAELIDPQQRVVLQEAWRAIEHAGYNPRQLKGSRCGIYIGCSPGDYDRVLAHHGRDRDGQAFMGTSSAILASRIAYYLDLKGPALSVDTACSSSLTALHLACESLRFGETDIVLSGGVNIFSSPLAQIHTSQVGMQSAVGRCRSFDESADGTVFSEGCAVVMLKRRADAERDNDAIIGLIKASGINQDGKTNGITAPSALSQAQLISDVYQRFSIDPEKISYVEAHGTATPLGDPIEVRALSKAFKSATNKTQYCAIGSVKTNIGHASYAAGIAGFVKLLLCLQNKKYVPSLHFNVANTHIDFASSPFFVNTEAKPWPKTDGQERIGAVSSFGFSGTNAHIVLQEYDLPIVATSQEDHRKSFVFPISAESDSQLAEMVDNLCAYLSENRPLELSSRREEEAQFLAALAFTLQTGRAHMSRRVAVAAADLNRLRTDLTALKTSILSGEGLRCNRDTATAIDEKLWLTLDSWLEGGTIDWSILGGHKHLRRLNLPGYSFAKERCWPVTKVSEVDDQVSQVSEENPLPAIEMDTSQARSSVFGPGSLVISLKDLFSEFLKLDSLRFNDTTNFQDLGLDSIGLNRLTSYLNKALEINLSPAELFANSTIHALATHICEVYPALAHIESDGEEDKTSVTSTGTERQAANACSDSGGAKTSTVNNHEDNEPIAIIGMSGKFPGAEDLDDFWENTLQARDCIRPLPENRWFWQGGDRAKHHVEGGFLKDILSFDPAFFGMTEDEARYTDPQHRLLLTHTYWAIENAGYTVDSLAGSDTAVLMAVGNSDYRRAIETSGADINALAATGTFSTLAANRISYFLDTHGPSESIDTACSSALIAINRAFNLINQGVSDRVIVGGVNLMLGDFGHQVLGAANLLSASNRCQSFSSNADGFVRSEGVAVLMLSKLSTALENGDRIYGIVKGGAENHGGRANSLTTPNPSAQAEVIAKAYLSSGVDFNSVSYIETHGSGTEIGDPIEIEGLKAADRALTARQHTQTKRDSPCIIGTVKSNIGHTEIVSGLASIIKVLYQFRDNTIAKCLHCQDLNPYIRLEGANFEVAQNTRVWQKDQHADNTPLVAGISAFGLGGANAHVILQSFDQTPTQTQEIHRNDSLRVITISAKSASQLESALEDLLVFTENNIDTLDLTNLAYTLQRTRSHMNYRVAFLVDSIDALKDELSSFVNTSSDRKISARVITNTNMDEGDCLRAQVLASAANAIHDNLVSRGDTKGLAQYWVCGGQVDWLSLYHGLSTTLISLPPYSMTMDSYWISAQQKIVSFVARTTSPNLEKIPSLQDCWR